MSLILEASLGPVKDQGREGSCFAFAGAGHREFLFRNYHRYEKQTAMVAATEAVFAAQYLFYRVHELEGTLREDCGGQLGSVFKVLDSVGICLEKNSAYSPAAAWTTPTAMQDAEAASFQAGAYHRLNTVDDMKSCLASGYTFVAGFAMHVSFQKENWLATGVMPVPSTTEPVLGGHAVLFFGYDDDRKAFRARSSWGAGMEPRWKFLVPLPSGGRSQHTLGCVDATLGQGLVMMEVLRVPRRRTSHVT
jgi:hypothetical protein